MKTRLNQRGRQALYRLAREVVSCPDNQAVADAAYLHAKNLVTNMIISRFPPIDMLILKRYDVTQENETIYISNLRGVAKKNNMGCWCFQADDKPPLTPYSCSIVYEADDDTRDAVEASIHADEALEDAIKTKLTDYNALIEASVTFEQVLEVWPEAEKARASCGASQITVPLDDMVIGRIRADVATRQIAA